MPIDGIGKPPSVPPPGGTAAPSGTSAPSGEAFRVGAPAASSVSSGDLARLERGELDLDAYLDARVSDATKHLEGRLGRAELEFVKQTLRSELESDPVLVELLRRATGKATSAAT